MRDSVDGSSFFELVSADVLLDVDTMLVRKGRECGSLRGQASTDCEALGPWGALGVEGVRTALGPLGG